MTADEIEASVRKHVEGLENASTANIAEALMTLAESYRDFASDEEANDDVD